MPVPPLATDSRDLIVGVKWSGNGWSTPGNECNDEEDHGEHREEIPDLVREPGDPLKPSKAAISEITKKVIA